MRTKGWILVAAITCITTVTALAVQKKAIHSWNFDSDKSGEVAAGFKAESGEWKIVADDAAPSKPNVFAQMAKNDDRVFNIALLNEPAGKNIDFHAKFHVAGGKIQQGGGLICRAKDAKNYYLFAYSPIDQSIFVYKVIDDVRTIIHTVADVEEVEGWQTIRLVTNGKRLEGHLNGEARFSIIDEAISHAGKVGLWTRADSQTHFDDLQLEVMDR